MLISTLCPGRKIEWPRPFCLPYARRNPKRQTVMLKSIIAIVVSYVAMLVLFMAVFAGLYFVFGVERVLQADSYEISTLWLVLSIVGSFFVALLTGWLCVRLSNSFRVGEVFALVVLVGSAIMCVSSLYHESGGPNVRAGEVGFFDAMERGVSPRWLHFVNPVLTAAGALAGSRLKRGAQPNANSR